MLNALRFQNLGLFEKAEVTLQPGLCVLTGESGAGKSLVLSGLSLLAGGLRTRIRPREGCSSGFVEAEFNIGGAEQEPLRDLLSREGLDDGDQLIIARRLQESGRTRAFVQGQQVSRTLLETLGEHLFEFCDQGQSHGLKAPAAQLEALDDFLGLSSARRALRTTYDSLAEQETEYARCHAERAENERRLEFVEFQLEELRTCDLAEFPVLTAQLEEAERAEALGRLVSSCIEEFDHGPHSVEGKLRFVSRQLEAADWGDDQAQSKLCDESRRLLAEVTGLADAFRAVQNSLSPLAPEERLRLEEQVKSVTQVAAKHRCRPDELSDKLKDLERLHDSLRAAGHKLSVLERQVQVLRAQAEMQAAELHERRADGASRFDRQVSAEFEALGLLSASLESHIAQGTLGPTGTSRISMGFSPHRSSAPLPLGRVASGGELARVLLGMRLALGRRSQLLCFDEIDAGTGGEMATRVGQALKRAGSGGQVLCITHWPQVAGLADTHLLVDKQNSEAQTTSTLRVLAEDERLAELTRMLGGQKETAKQHARHLRLSAA